MGKADMLNKGARKTATGLFQGMVPLEARKEPETVKQTPTKEDADVEKKVDESNDSAEMSKKETVDTSGTEVEVNEVEEKSTESEEKNDLLNPPQTTEADEKSDKYEVPGDKKETAVSGNVIASKKSKDTVKTGSRYEKEKFLLLDIRGYRDYVEHMAKAANMSATKYIRNLIKLDMDKNMDIYEAHKALEEKLKGRSGN